jgi:hypothetical protein
MIQKILYAFAILVSFQLSTSAKDVPSELTHHSVKFYVQIGASSVPIDRSEYAKTIDYPIQSVSVLKDHGCYKYVVGEFDYFEEAIELCDSFIKSKSIEDIHIVASMDDNYIELVELPTPYLDREPTVSFEQQDDMDAIVYGIQIFASTNPALTVEKLKSLMNLEGKLYVDETNGVRRYIIDMQDDINAVRASLERIKKRGAVDAFLVVYRHGVRISIGV